MNRIKNGLLVYKLNWQLLLLSISLLCMPVSCQNNNLDEMLIPAIDGDWWTVTGDPDLGLYTTTNQQPVDFAIWQAADGTWQILSCVRATNIGGKTRLFHRWQGKNITDRNWTPMGIFMEADTSFGETLGCLQSPYVLKIGKEYHLFYGDWMNICLAKGVDGKTFARQLQPNGESGMFSEGPGYNTTLDVMVIRIGKLYYAYYNGKPNNEGAVYVRTSKDFKSWSASKKVNLGGSPGSGLFSSECPQVYFHKPSGYYYLFRTQAYGTNAQTSVYRSKDPLYFGVNDDSNLMTTLPVAAPEIVEHEGQLYIAALLPSLKGMRIAKLRFVPKR